MPELRRSSTPISKPLPPPPSDSPEMKSINGDHLSVTKERAQSLSSMDEKYTRRSLDAASTLYSASTLGGTAVDRSSVSLSSTKRRARSSSSASSFEDLSSFQGRFSRRELARILGEDAIPHSTEIDTIPCAGLHIGYGKLNGLMVWRLVVRFPGVPTTRSAAVLGNFILDTGAQSSRIAPEVLTALGYKHDLIPGTPVKLVIQGVEHECVVAEFGEACRLSADYLISGSLAFHFAWKMDAPVLYVENSKNIFGDVPRTVSKIQRIQEKVRSLIDKVIPRASVDTPSVTVSS